MQSAEWQAGRTHDRVDCLPSPPEHSKTMPKTSLNVLINQNISSQFAALQESFEKDNIELRLLQAACDADMVELSKSPSSVDAMIIEVEEHYADKLHLVMRLLESQTAIILLTSSRNMLFWELLSRSGAHLCWLKGDKSVEEMKLQMMHAIGRAKEQILLQAAEKRTRTIIRLAPEAIVETDSFGRISSANMKLESLFGWTSEELRGKLLSECLVPERFRKRFEEMLSAYRSADSSYAEAITGAIEFIGLTKHGAEVPIELSAATIGVKEQVRIAFFFHDVSARLSAEEKERKLLLMKQRETFSATLTHDLKSPLLGSIRVIEALLDGKINGLTSELKRILEQLQNCNLVQLELIKDLLNLYKVSDEQTHTGASSMEPTEFYDMIAACKNDLIAHAEARNISISLQVEGERLPCVTGDSNKLRRVIYNLLDNALKYGKENSTVRMRVTHNESTVNLEIEDDGPGIPQTEVASLFTRFQQGAAGVSSRFGSGLGLHLCKQIVEAYGGTISCSSEEGTGTKFTVSLPSLRVHA